MHSVIVGAVFVRFEHIRAAYFFKKAVVFCRGLAVEIEFRKQRIDFLCVCAVFGIAGNGRRYLYLNSVSGFHGVQFV